MDETIFTDVDKELYKAGLDIFDDMRSMYLSMDMNDDVSLDLLNLKSTYIAMWNTIESLPKLDKPLGTQKETTTGNITQVSVNYDVDTICDLLQHYGLNITCPHSLDTLFKRVSSNLFYRHFKEEETK